MFVWSVCWLESTSARERGSGAAEKIGTDLFLKKYICPYFLEVREMIQSIENQWAATLGRLKNLVET